MELHFRIVIVDNRMFPSDALLSEEQILYIATLSQYPFLSLGQNTEEEKRTIISIRTYILDIQYITVYLT